MQLKGSQTEKNLEAALAGESIARNKYTFYSDKAKADGYEQIAELFEETAKNEKAHAQIWYNLLKGKTCFSTLSVTDKDGNTDSYEPVSTRDINYTDHYQELLTGWISYIQKNYPKYNRYVELIKLLGQEFTLKEASAILHKPQRTLYGWVQTLRPIFKEYMRTIDRI